MTSAENIEMHNNKRSVASRANRNKPTAVNNGSSTGKTSVSQANSKPGSTSKVIYKVSLHID